MNPTAAEHAVALRRLMPEPLCSSRARGWRGATVELYRLGDLEFTAAHPEHVVSMQVTACASLLQRRNGQESERPLEAGEIIVTPAGEPKFWRRRGEGTLLLIALQPRFLDDVLAQATGRCGAHAQLLDNFGTREKALEAAAHALRAELIADELGGRLFAESVIVQLALHLLRRHCSVALHGASPARMSPRKLQQVKTFVEDHLAEDLAVETLARAVTMSVFHFAHAFRDATGEPPYRYVLRRRVERAKSLLRDTDLPLTEIAQRVGYSSPSHFCVAFRRLADLSPSQFRHR